MKKIFLPALFVGVCATGAFAQNAASGQGSGINTPNAWVKAMNQQKTAPHITTVTTSNASADAGRVWSNAAKAGGQTAVVSTNQPVIVSDPQKTFIGWMQPANSTKTTAAPNENNK